MQDIIKIVIEGIIAILGTITLQVVIPYIKLKIESTWIEKAVKAAEQIYIEAGSGEKKKQYVIEFLLSKGIIKLDKDGEVPFAIDVLIEAAVNQLDQIVKA